MTNAPRHDYDQFIADWLARPPTDPGERPQERIGFIRSGMAETLRKAGLSADELAGEMAHFDAAAMRFLNVKQASIPVEQAPSMPGLDEPLGFRRWLGVVWLALGWAGGAAGVLLTLLKPISDTGGIATPLFFGAPATLSLIVLAAAVPALADRVRRYGGVGFLFWLPLFLLSYAVAVAPLTLLDGFVNSMGSDFLPLALPLAGALFAILALPSLWFLFRRLSGRARPLTEPGADGRSHPVMNILLAGFSVLLFTIGAQKMLDWGPGPSVVVGLFVTGLILRIFLEREITWVFAPIVALPLALLAAEMPPSNLAALTVLGLALAAGLVVMLVTWARGERRKVLFTSLTTAALALVLVMAPTGPSPALWLADKLGHPLKPLGDAAMGFYAQAYQTERGHAVLAALDGYRSAALSTRIEHYDLKDRTIALTVDLGNIGEKGIRSIRVYPVDQEDPLEAFAGCDRPFFAHAFPNTLWPGDVKRTALKWTAPAECPAATLNKLSEHIHAGLVTDGWRDDLEIEVLETRAVDPVLRFRADARGWLGL